MEVVDPGWVRISEIPFFSAVITNLFQPEETFGILTQRHNMAATGKLYITLIVTLQHFKQKSF